MHANPALIVAGLAVGTLVGLTGMGGGSLMTPLLIMVFGFDPVTAVGTDILHGALFKTVGSWRHVRMGSANMRLAMLLSMGAVPASIVGVHYSAAISADVLKSVLGITLVAVAVLMFAKTVLARHVHPEGPDEVSTKGAVGAVAIGVACGAIVGMTSVGSGSLVGLALMLFFTLPARRVVGTDMLNAAVMLWAAGLSHLFAGNVNLPAMGLLLVGSVPGVIVGSHLTLRVPDRPLRITLGLVIGLSGAKLAGAPDLLIAAGLAAAALYVTQAALRASRIGQHLPCAARG